MRRTCSDTRETDPLYAARRNRASRHDPALLQLGAVANVVLPAWMHMGSTVRNLGLAHVGDTLSARARVTQNYVHKGHKFVEVDALVLANETHAAGAGDPHRDLSAAAVGGGRVADAQSADDCVGPDELRPAQRRRHFGGA